jgi:hypothetical protein
METRVSTGMIRRAIGGIGTRRRYTKSKGLIMRNTQTAHHTSMRGTPTSTGSWRRYPVTDTRMKLRERNTIREKITNMLKREKVPTARLKIREERKDWMLRKLTLVI